MLVSNQGVYVTHPDPEQLGKLASDLPEHALEAIRGGQALRFVNAQRAWVFQPLRIGGVETAWSMVVTFDLRAALG
jgi:methyl-accepting chemotaxis protein